MPAVRPAQLSTPLPPSALVWCMWGAVHVMGVVRWMYQGPVWWWVPQWTCQVPAPFAPGGGSCRVLPLLATRWAQQCALSRGTGRPCACMSGHE